MLAGKLECLLYLTFYSVRAAVALDPTAALTNNLQHRQPQNDVSLDSALQASEEPPPLSAQISAPIGRGVAVTPEAQELTDETDVQDDKAIHDAGTRLDRQHYGRFRGSSSAVSANLGGVTAGSLPQEEGKVAQRYHMVALKGGLGVQRRQADAVRVQLLSTMTLDIVRKRPPDWCLGTNTIF